MQWSEVANVMSVKTILSHRLNGVCVDEGDRKGRRVAESEPKKSTTFMDVMFTLDNRLTLWMGMCAKPQTKWQRALKMCCMCLEMSGHGLVWFAVCGVLMLLHLTSGWQIFWNHSMNMLFMLILDIIVVAPIKLYCCRSRPALNQGSIPLSVSSVDNYSFPSGHASRCVALAAYFCYIPPFYLRTHLWYIWAAVVSLSRVLIGRHHISDVVAGMVAGLVVFDIIRRSGLLYGVVL